MVLFGDHVKLRKLQKTSLCLRRGKVEEMKSEDSLEQLKVGILEKIKSHELIYLKDLKLLMAQIVSTRTSIFSVAQEDRTRRKKMTMRREQISERA